jgi:uncharacterized protein (TIGR00661 family)
MIKCKVYLSDEGFGHLVRQEAVIKSLIKMSGNKIHFTIQTRNKYSFLSDKFSFYNHVKFIKKYNNIETRKRVDGSLDLLQTSECFKNYKKNSQLFIEEELSKFNYDFVISDAVPDAHKIAKIMNVPSFSIFHFNWAWFCKKVYPELIDVSNLMLEMYKLANITFLPPFPPVETLENFKKNVVSTPFIINNFDNISLKPHNKKKILVMDNGTSTLSKIIISNFKVFEDLQQYHFYIPKNLAKEDTLNITRIQGVKHIHSHIPKMDVIVARAGYNTLTESLISKVPALFVNETKNPEIAHNISEVFDKGYGGKMTVSEYKNNFKNCFENFIETDYNKIKKKLLKNNFQSNGADVIAKNILDYLGI